MDTSKQAWGIVAMATMTVKGLAGEIKAAKVRKTPVWVRDGGPKGAGQLVAKIASKGASFYYDHVTSAGKRDRIPLGPYSEKTQEGYLTLEQARAKAGEHAAIYRTITKDVRLHLDQQRIDHERTLERQKAEREKANAGSLGALLDAYVDHLRTAEKPSSKDVASFFRIHVAEPFPALVSRPANDLGKRDFTPLFDRMQAAGLGRALGKVRSALHAAYNMALKSEKAGREAFRVFHVEVNPIAGIDTYKELSVPGERVLTVKELRTYLRGIDALTNPVMRLAMLLQIYLGGQRPAQLFRVTAADVDMDRNTITQYDGKGKRQRPCAAVDAKDPAMGGGTVGPEYRCPRYFLHRWAQHDMAGNGVECGACDRRRSVPAGRHSPDRGNRDGQTEDQQGHEGTTAESWPGRYSDKAL